MITWVMAESDRRFVASDVVFAEELGQRGAIAIDNARLHSQTLEVAVQLQRAVLADLPDTLAEWDVATFYSPAGRTEVGGDFYDALELPDGRLALFIGDVMGRGFAAAAAMAQMRASVRAFVALDPSPEAVLGRLDTLFVTYPLSQLVTLVYLVADTRRHELVMGNAGHPPPVILRADGTPEQLVSSEEAPLGAGIGRRTVSTVPISAGDTLMVFTDGLIERRDEDIDCGQARLVSSMVGLSTRSLQAALEQVVDEVRDHDRQDDVAALAVRWRPS